MNFYRVNNFTAMEFASESNWNTTFQEARRLIENCDEYKFVPYDTYEEMYSIHKNKIFNPAKSNSKKLKEDEYDGFRKSMVICMEEQ